VTDYLEFSPPRQRRKQWYLVLCKSLVALSARHTMAVLLLTCKYAMNSKDDAKFCHHLLICLSYTHVTLSCSDLLFNEMCDYKDWDKIHVESTKVARGKYDFDPCRNCTQSISFLLYALCMPTLRWHVPVVLCLFLPLLVASTFSRQSLYIRVSSLYIS